MATERNPPFAARKLYNQTGYKIILISSGKRKQYVTIYYC